METPGPAIFENPLRDIQMYAALVEIEPEPRSPDGILQPCSFGAPHLQHAKRLSKRICYAFDKSENFVETISRDKDVRRNGLPMPKDQTNWAASLSRHLPPGAAMLQINPSKLHNEFSMRSSVYHSTETSVDRISSAMIGSQAYPSWGSIS